MDKKTIIIIVCIVCFTLLMMVLIPLFGAVYLINSFGF